MATYPSDDLTSPDGVSGVVVVAGSPTAEELQAVLAALAVASARARAAAAAAEAVRRLPRQRRAPEWSRAVGWQPVLDRWSLHGEPASPDADADDAVSIRAVAAS